MKRMGYRWAKIRGAYRLSRRSIARIVAAISAALLAFHAVTANISPADEALNRRVFNALCVAFPLADSMPPAEVRIAVSDRVFDELADVFFKARPYLVAKPMAAPPVAAQSRRYPTRKAMIQKGQVRRAKLG